MSSPDTSHAMSFARLLAEARAGSTDALGRALMTCRDYLLQAANRKLDAKVRPKINAADLVQDTFLDALRDFAHFQGKRREELRAWLGQILFHNLSNRVRDYLATKKRSVDRELSLNGRASRSRRLEEIADNLRSPSSSAAAHERESALESALSQLPEHYQHVLHLRHQEKQTFAEIGATLNCSTESARKLWGRALNRLQKALSWQQGEI